MSYINRNVSEIKITGIRKFFNKVNEVKDAVSMTIGQPDFPVPEEIKNAMKEAIDNDNCGYTKNEGILELREEISKYLNKQGIVFSTDDICVTAGGSEGIFSTIAALCDEGDKFLVPDPAYPAYDGCVKMMGGELIKYPLDDQFQPDIDAIERLMNEKKIKGIIISYPCNPTGALLNKESYDKLKEVLSKKDTAIISDEMYSSIIYDEEEFYSFAQDELLKKRTILIGGFSKIFSMTGLRVGYICACKEILDKIKVVHQHNTTCANSVAQIGAAVGLRECMKIAQERNEEFKARRDYVCEKLREIGFNVVIPKGAFYVFAKYPMKGMKSEELCDRLLYEGKVALVPGSAFGELGEGYVRVSYSYSMENLKEGLNRIEQWFNSNK